MLFWAGILVGAFFAWTAVKAGFYMMWATLFNLIIAIYLAIYLRPIVIEKVPAVGGTTYCDGLTMISIAVAVFVILHGISYVFFTSQYKISFPRVIDTVGSGVLGFLAGMLVWNFVTLLIWITPVVQNNFVRELGFNEKFKQSNISYLSKWVGFVNSFATTEENTELPRTIILKLLERKEKPPEPEPKPEPEPIELQKPQPEKCEKPQTDKEGAWTPPITDVNI